MKRIPNNETAAICGLFCGNCPFYPERCHGCLSDKLTSHCITCPNGFRACVKEHNVTRCYECADFPCEKLNKFTKEHYENGIGHHETAIDDLQEMKDKGVNAWVARKTTDNTCDKCGEIIYWMDKNNHKCK